MTVIRQDIPASNATLGVVGDSTALVSYLPGAERWPVLLAAKLATRGIGRGTATVTAQNGAEMARFAPGGAQAPSTWLDQPNKKTRYVIRCGWNDDVNATFSTDLDAVLDACADAGSEAIITTNWPTGHARGWHDDPRTIHVADNNATMRAAAASRGLLLVDLHTLFDAEMDAPGSRATLSGALGPDVLDFRTRSASFIGETFGHTSTISPDATGDQDGAASSPWDIGWVSDIHPNSIGNELIAEWIAAALSQSLGQRG